MAEKRTLRRICVLTVVLCVFCGCERDPLDPAQIGRFRPTPVVNVILDSLGVASEEDAKFADAEAPQPIDLLDLEQDYVLSAGDYIDVSIFELLEEALPYENTFEISESGNISIPEVGQIQAAGLSEVQLEEEIKQILSPTILKSPSITVRLRSSQSRAFTILGEGVPKPGRYLLPGYTYRLADALADAGSPRQFNVSYIYVTRYEKRQSQVYQAPQPVYEEKDFQLTPVIPDEKDSSEELLEIIAPHTSKAGGKKINYNGVIITASEAATLRELKSLAAPEGIDFDEDDDLLFEELETEPIAKAKSKPMRTEWIFRDGRWVAVQVEDESGVDEVVEDDAADMQEQDESAMAMDLPDIGTDLQSRVIKIPVRTIGIDPKYNIIIRPGDTINAPFDVVGEIVVMGNVNRQGYIDITGRPMTLMQAIAAAGGLGQLAEPSCVEVRRRIGENREQIVSVNLDKIAKGLQPDFFVKQDDTINVGTLPSSRFAAVLRNAFRATYGFGFIYDRNFADRDFGTRRPLPNIF